MTRDPALKLYRPRSLDFAQIDLLNTRKCSSQELETNSCAKQIVSQPLCRRSYTKARLQCTWKDRTPHFTFLVDNKPHEILLANPVKIECLVDNTLELIYHFSRNGRNNSCEPVGKMKVSSSLLLTTDGSKLSETEFVLFGTSLSHSRAMEGASPSFSTETKGSSKTKVLKMFLPSHLHDHNSSQKLSETAPLCCHQERDFHPNYELAAVVVRRYISDVQKEAEVGGWGLKFLHKDKFDSVETITSLDVLVPKGFHGGPCNESCSPSSLIERFRSGGHCDCEGWDLGCPLRVLRHAIVSSPAIFVENFAEKDQALYLTDEGGGRNAATEPALKMVRIDERSYSILFDQSLLALQSMSIAMGVIHSSSTSMHPKL